MRKSRYLFVVLALFMTIFLKTDVVYSETVEMRQARINELRSVYPNYSTWTDSFDGGSQCFGFARLMGYKVFGTMPSTWQVVYSISDVKVGDIVRYGNSGSEGHSIFVTNVEGDTITFLDCNGNGNYSGANKVRTCGIKWDNKVGKWNKLFGYSFSYLRSSPELEQIQPIPAPTHANLEKTQHWYDITDTIGLIPSADVPVDYYWLNLSGNNKKIEKAIYATYTIAASELGYGDYSAYIAAANSSGAKDSERVYFSVVKEPSYTDVSISNTLYDIGDTVIISVSPVCAKTQVIGIYNSAGTPVVMEETGTTFSCPASRLGVGKYYAYFSIVNGSGTIDTRGVNFEVVKYQYVSGVTLDKTSLSMKKGESKSITATVSPSDATNKTVKWSSSNTSVATVTNGVVTAIGEGQAVITATTENGGKTAKCTVTVETSVTGISLSSRIINMAVGKSATLSAIITPSDATNKSVKWSSSNSSIVTVSNGVVKAGSEGVATITATTVEGGKQAKCLIRVGNNYKPYFGDLDGNGAIAATDLSEINNVIKGKGTITDDIRNRSDLNADGSVDQKDYDLMNQYLLGSISAFPAETYADFDEDGRYSAADLSTMGQAANGRITLTEEWKRRADLNGDGMVNQNDVDLINYMIHRQINWFPVEAKPLVSGLSLSDSSLSLKSGESKTLTATVTPTDAANKSVRWASENPQVAKVDSSGKVTAVGIGSTKVTVSAVDGGIVSECTVTVADEKPITKVTGITLRSDKVSMEVGTWVPMSAEISPSDATDKSIEWTSSNTNIVTVEDGTITAAGKGTAVVTATTVDGKKKASCTVTVVEARDHYYGDINGDNKILSTDFTMISMWIRNTSFNLTDDQKKRADLNGDGAIDKKDHDLLRAYLLGDILEFPVERKSVIQGGTFALSSVTGTPGSNVTVDLTVKDNPGLTSLKTKITYPTDVLELTSVDYPNLFSSKATGLDRLESPFILSWYSSQSKNESANGILARLTFKIKENARADSYEIGLSYNQEDIFQIDDSEVAFAIEKGTVTVADTVPGDCNGDKMVNMKDIVLLQKSLNGWIVSIDKNAADVNKDGKMNMKDIVLLQQKLNGYDVVLK